MILDVARHKFYEGFFTLLIMTIAMIGVVAFSGGDATPTPNTPLMTLINSITGDIGFVKKIVTVLLYTISVLSLTRSAIRTHIYTVDTMAPLALCSVVMFPLVCVGNSLYQSIVVFLLALTLGNMFYCFGPRRCLHHLFMTMVAAGTLPLMDATFAPITLAVCLALILARKRFREAIVTVVGMLLPLFIQCYVLWFMGGEFASSIEHMWSDITTLWTGDIAERGIYIVEYISIPHLIFIGCIIFMQSVSSTLYFTEQDVHSTVVRGAWRAMHFILIVAICSTILFSTSLWQPFTIIAMVAVMMFPMLFVHYNTLISTIAYIALIACSVTALF